MLKVKQKWRIVFAAAIKLKVKLKRFISFHFSNVFDGKLIHLLSLAPSLKVKTEEKVNWRNRAEPNNQFGTYKLPISIRCLPRSCFNWNGNPEGCLARCFLYLDSIELGIHFSQIGSKIKNKVFLVILVCRSFFYKSFFFNCRPSRISVCELQYLLKFL